MFSSITLSDIAKWCDVECPPTAHKLKVFAISTDSRTIKKGDIYLALRGEKFDGHRFLEECVAKGAAALISEQKINTIVPVLQVSDSLGALVKIGKGLRHRFKGPVVAITGSAGKSSTKEMTSTLLGSSSVCSPASYNNLIGVSKTLCLVQDATQFLVLEMGMNAPKEISELCRHFEPTGGLITNIGNAHIGKLGSIESIYLAKKELFDFLSKAGKGVALNIDDPLVVKAYEQTFTKGIPTVKYSALGKAADVTVEKMTINPLTAHLSVRVWVGGRKLDYECPIFGMHHTQNLAAALAVQLLLGTPLIGIVDRLTGIRPAAHRGEIFRLSSGKILIDESYNSNPAALVSSLESLEKLAADRATLIVLGDMLEMGSHAERVHVEAGIALAKLFGTRSKLTVMGVGALMRFMVEELKQRLPRLKTHWAENVAEAKPLVCKLLESSDTIFIKGSNGVHLDDLVHYLTQPN